MAGSKSAGQKEDDDDDQKYADQARRAVSPAHASAYRERAEQEQDQEN
jgi:hypothetical protein